MKQALQSGREENYLMSVSDQEEFPLEAKTYQRYTAPESRIRDSRKFRVGQMSVTAENFKFIIEGGDTWFDRND